MTRALAWASLLAAVAASGACRRSRIKPRGDAVAVVVRAVPDAAGPAPLVEKEPNDSPREAEILALAGEPPTVSVLGKLAAGKARRDVDVFRLVVPGAGDAAAPATQRLAIDVVPDPDLAVQLQVTGAAGQVILRATGGRGERVGVPNLAALPGAAYAVEIADAVGARRGGSQTTPDAAPGRGYLLALRLAAFDPGDEREPNDGAEDATALGLLTGRPEVAGFLASRQDQDWYAIDLDGVPEGWLVDAEASAVPAVSVSLTLMNADGAPVAAARGGRGERVRVRAPLPPVREAGGSAVGRRCFVVVRAERGANLDRRYVLGVRPVMPEDERAPPEPGAEAASPRL